MHNSAKLQNKYNQIQTHKLTNSPTFYCIWWSNGCLYPNSQNYDNIPSSTFTFRVFYSIHDIRTWDKNVENIKKIERKFDKIYIFRLRKTNNIEK